MSSRGIARLGLLASGLVISATVALTPEVAAAGVVNGAAISANTSITGAKGHVAQQGNGCERVRRPACNRPGRRSTHR
ncbi:MAG: hypothetical protein QOG47_2736 [Mycobacterium sp.]|jgi:hypothetical protein|nr:hypothetical protein [Mycobacterium sp.]